MVPAVTPRGWFALKLCALERAQPLSAYLELTYACNWRCLICYNPRHHDPHPLSIEEWTNVLDDLRSLGALNVTFTGGEPLAYPGFLEVARRARARALTLRLLTNGSLITEAIADAIAELRPLGVEISLHGARAESHDRATATPGSFAALFAALALLQRRGVRLLLKTVLTRANEDELEEMASLAARHGVPYRVDSTLMPRIDGDPRPLAFEPSAAGLERHYRRLAALGRLPEAERRHSPTNCGLGRLTVVVDPEGEVYPCMQSRCRSLGNVNRVRLPALWKGSGVRDEAVATAREANARLGAADPALARFPFCPALAQRRFGDPFALGARHRFEAALVARIRDTKTP